MGISKVEIKVEQLAVGDTLHYTVPVGTTAEVTSATVCNMSAAVASFSLFTPNPAAVAAATNLIIDLKPVLIGQTPILSEILGKTFGAGTAFRTTASAATALNLHISLDIKTTS